MDKVSTNILPQLHLLTEGDQLKVYVVTGEAGMQMPPHLSTREAIVIVLEGGAVLNIKNSNVPLFTGDVIIIPAGVAHSLSIEKRFKANVIMNINSTIKFIN